MKALTWQGTRDVQVSEVPDPVIEKATDAIVRVTSSGICGSDLRTRTRRPGGDPVPDRERFVHDVRSGPADAV